MPTVVTERPYRDVPVDPPRKRWTREECAFLEARGAWGQQKLELVDGELINKMGKNRAHVNSLALILAWLIEVFGKQYVNSEAPIDVAPEDNPSSEPEPDLIVLSRPLKEFPKFNPQPKDIHLLVEVSESTLGFDLTTKAKLYARAGISEYWVLDIDARRLVVHRDPEAGQYRSVAAYRELESVRPLAAPERDFRVADAFPEPA